MFPDMKQLFYNSVQGGAMQEIRIKEPFTKEKFADLKAGDNVLLSGTVYTARDAAHKRMTEAVEAGKELPFDMHDAVIYYVGPTPAKDGRPIGSAGPTSSYRMDAYAPIMMEKGQSAMIGKGPRNKNVIDAIVKTGSIYFAAIGGAGALISRSIKKAEIIAYEDLGAEAVRKLEVEDLPLIVAIDSKGCSLFERKE
jgi:fumarate hydratase subunit beta